MRNYYALEQVMGRISVWSEYGRPVLHVFGSKKERDEFVENYDASDINHSAHETTAKVAYAAYSHIVDGTREWDVDVVNH